MEGGVEIVLEFKNNLYSHYVCVVMIYSTSKLIEQEEVIQGMRSF